VSADLLARATRKATYRFLPILTIGYLFCYLDRTCIGFAALTMNKDLGLSATQFGIGGGIFFLGYCLCEIPSNLALFRYGARRWIARIMITWGIASAGTALIVGPHSFYAVRLLVGIAEAGFFPGVTFFLASWFPAEQRTRMLAWFIVGVPLSSLVGAPLCGALLQLNGVLGLAGWQWLFVALSLPCVILGLIVLRMLADHPRDAEWLTPEERQALEAALSGEKRERPKSALRHVFGDPRVLILVGVQFGFVLVAYDMGVWLPLMLQAYNLSTSMIVALTMAPYVVATIGMLIWAGHVDRGGGKIRNLAWTSFIPVPALIGAVFASNSLPLALIGLTIGLLGVSSARAIFWSIPTRFLTGVAAAGGLAFINSIGTAGAFVGPPLIGWLKDYTGSFNAGILVMAGVMAAATILALSLKLLVREE
jgi:MFS family permease